jgi:hypothetical protein
LDQSAGCETGERRKRTLNYAGRCLKIVDNFRWRIITPIEEAWAQLPAPDFPNYAAGSEGPTSWHELLEIRGNSAERAIGHGE